MFENPVSIPTYLELNEKINFTDPFEIKKNLPKDYVRFQINTE